MEKSKRIITFSCIPLFLCFLMFLYAPLETYVQNSADFTYDIYDLLKVMLPVFTGVYAVAVLLLFLVHRVSEKLYKLAAFLLVLIPLIMYVQGAFFSSFLPQLDGETMDWSAYPRQRGISILLWLIAISCSVVFALKCSLPKCTAAARAISLAGAAFLLITLFLLLLLPGKAFENRKNLAVTGDDMLTLSPEENVVVLVLDMVGDPEFSDYLERNPEKQKVFEDFTHFNNAVGGYRYTVCSIPYIFSGEWFLYQCDFDEYKNKAFESSVLLSSLYSKGYSLGVYDADVPLTEDSSARFINVHEPSSNRFRNPLKFILMQLELAGLRYLPFDLKPFCVLTPENIAYDCAKGTAGENLFSAESIYLYSQLDAGISPSAAGPCFRFIHVQGAHPPYIYDSQMNRVEDASYDEVLGSCVTLVEKLLSEMKKSAVYDASSIVIMADHGGNDSRQNPILYVKGAHERHPLQHNAAPVIWGDLQQAFMRLAEGKHSGDIFSVHEGDQRERYYYSYDVFGNDPLIEYIQYGDASNAGTLLPTGNVYTKN